MPQNEMLQAAIRAIGDGVTIADAEGQIIYSNPAADRILGTSASAAPAEEWADHYGVFLPDRETPFPADQYPLVRAVKGQSTDNVEMFVRNDGIPNGAVISVTGRPVRNSHGDIIGAVAVFRDITRLRRAEEQKRELTGFLVHDMKSPLSSIMANCDIVHTSGDLEGDDREALADALESARTLNHMVLNLLDIQTAEDGYLNPVLAAVTPLPLLEEVARNVSGRAGDTEIHVQGPAVGTVPDVKADRELLRRVITNLVDNCLKYGPGNGRIWLKARDQDDDTVLFTVTDDGPGVPSELVDSIFERYAKFERTDTRRDPGSRGLGLRFCKLAVEAHNGSIWVEDNEAVGARFCVELPMAAGGT